MIRRQFLTLAGAALALPAGAHTPYGQWVVYRQKHLLVGAHRKDMRTYLHAKSIVSGLEAELPEAQARVARGPRPQRIASLIGTGQLFLTVLSAEEAGRMARAEAPFKGYPPTPVHALVSLDADYLLYAAPEFPADHAALVTKALDHAGLGFAPVGAEMHPGAESYWE